MKKIIFISILTIVLFLLKYQEGLSTSSITISCPPSTCVIGNCQCNINGCVDGYVYFYDINECSGPPLSEKPFSTASFNWSPDAGTYYLKARCMSGLWSDCTTVTLPSPSTTSTTSATTTTAGSTTSTIVTTTSTTTTISVGCSYDNPCPADCGKRKLNQATNTQDYFEFFIDSVSNVTVKLEPSQNVDYDLYVNWNETKPEYDNYDCKPLGGMGEKKVCKKTGLLEGTYYIMVSYYEGIGTYNLSINCTPTGVVTTSCSNQDQPCKIDCGKSKLDRSTTARDYFMFKLTSKSNVTVKLFPTSNVDYELYVNWDGKKPTVDKYDCKSASGEGEKEECNVTSLETGTYYIMIDFYGGIGTYDLSLACSPIKVTTTTTISTTTTATTAITTTSVNVSTTIKATTTSAKISSCGPSGYCEGVEEDCKSGYEECSDNDVDCGIDEKCCCVAEIRPEPSNVGLIVGLIVVLLIVILIFFFIKGRSRITFEKLYRKWTRLLIDTPKV
jgi:hypothetical protein